MAIHTENMQQVPDPGARVDEGWYHVRITKATEDVSSSSGGPVVKMLMKIQDEGPNLGRTIPDSPSLQSHALFKLKAYYNAVGYKPGPEGHDPEKLVDGECFVYVEHSMHQGKPNINIPSWSVRSVLDGPGQGKPTKRKTEEVAA